MDFISCYNDSPIMLTEGAIGTRVASEFALKSDPYVKHVGLIYSSEGRMALETIYSQYLQIAQDFALPILLTTHTRRANQENVLRSAFKDKQLIADYVLFLKALISRYQGNAYIGGTIGCRGDAYTGKGKLTTAQAMDFHAWQIDLLAQQTIDFIFVALMPSVEETLGIAKLIEQTKLPYIISFMLQEDGNLVDGKSIQQAIQLIDDNTLYKPVCYMANCIHPKLLQQALLIPCNNTAQVRQRFQGIQANASYLPASMLDKATTAVSSTAEELFTTILALHRTFPMKIYGGCCGTNETHIRKIAENAALLK